MTSFNDIFVVEDITPRWFLCLHSVDISALIQCSSSVRVAACNPSLWVQAARTWSYTKDLDHNLVDTETQPPWRDVCTFHERMWWSWRGFPKSVRLNLREELRKQRIADLEVVLVEFLAGEDAFVLGHSNGAVSIWELLPAGGWNARRGHDEHRLAEKDTSTPSAQTAKGPAMEARVLGVFQTSRSFDVQDLFVWPSPAEQPTALALGRTIFLAAAVGSSAFIWESSCSKDGEGRVGHPNSAFVSSSLGTWHNRGALRHAAFFQGHRHIVWAVKLTNCDQPGCRRAITVSEDCVLRAWVWGESSEDNGAIDGSVIWQYQIGDARQAVVTIMPAPPPYASSSAFSTTADFDGAIGAQVVVLSRADKRTVEVLDLDTGERKDKVRECWPAVGLSLPQCAAYDSGSTSIGPVALFSSITESGDGTLARVDLTPSSPPRRRGSRGSDATSSSAPSPPPPPLERPAFGADSRVYQVLGPLAGCGRVLRMAVPLPLADVFVTFIHEGAPMDVMEVWERRAVLGGECEEWDEGMIPDALPVVRINCVHNTSNLPPEELRNTVEVAYFRARVPPFLGNPRLVATGGRRLIFLDPSAFLSLGELRLLEWQPRARPSTEATTTEKKGSTIRRALSRKLSWVTSDKNGNPCCLPPCSCFAGVLLLLSRATLPCSSGAGARRLGQAATALCGDDGDDEAATGGGVSSARRQGD